MFVSERLLAFRTGPEKHNVHCRRRSESRLKNNTSCTDIRIWSFDCEDRRKAFLDLFRTCHNCPRIGNYVPIYEALKASGVNVPKVKEPDPTFIQILRFIFKNVYPGKKENSKPDLTTRANEGNVHFGSGPRSLMPKADKKKDYFGENQYARSHRLKRSLGEQPSEHSQLALRSGFSTTPASTVCEYGHPIHQAERRNFNMNSFLPILSSTSNNYGSSTEPESDMSFITGLSTSPESNVCEYGHPISQGGYTFEDDSTLGTDYTQSDKAHSVNSHAHASPEMCAAMCSYLKDQLKHFHELMFQKDLLMKQLEYHENNLPGKIKLSEQSKSPMLRRRRTDSVASHLDEMYLSSREQKTSTHRIKESKLYDSHKVSKKKSSTVHLVKSSVFTTRSVSSHHIEDIKKAKLFSKRRDFSNYTLEEYDKFVSEVKHVLSGVLKKFEVNDETVDSMSEEMLIKSYIEETEYRLDLINEDHRSEYHESEA